MKKIEVKPGISTLIDDDIADLIVKLGLKLKIERGGYVYVTGALHDLVANHTRGDGNQVDHINRNVLDNRRDNLRIVSRSDNMKNREIPAKLLDAKYYYYNNNRGKWCVYTPVENQRFGEYETEDEAKNAVSRMLSGSNREITLNNPSKGLPKYIHKVDTFGTIYYQVRPYIGGKSHYLGSFRELDEAIEVLNKLNRRIKK